MGRPWITVGVQEGDLLGRALWSAFPSWVPYYPVAAFQKGPVSEASGL